jgi:hypothetical protein
MTTPGFSGDLPVRMTGLQNPSKARTDIHHFTQGGSMSQPRLIRKN